MAIREVATRPFPDQRCGTAGLRKPVRTFQQPHYLENFLQSAFDVLPEWHGATLVIGGDGRYHNRAAIQTAISMAAANGVGRVIVGQGGLLSTPAASHLIRETRAAGGLLFTASHNPAGPDGDFGVKLSLAGGGQAGETVTERIYQRSQRIGRYRIRDAEPPHLDLAGVQDADGFEVEVVDPVEAYAALMQSLFDFDRMRRWLRGHRLRFDAMHAVTGPYARRLFVELLGAPPADVVNAVPKEDFGGGHPDPNLVHARALVDLMHGPAAPDFGAASDGDGDRNLILGRGLFVSPGDSLAILAAHLHELPGYRTGLRGVARSMPTSRAVDRVAQALGCECHETPSGWKFFGNLLEAGRVTICGEEAFGTSSSHLREKDGLWAVLAWLDVLAASGCSVEDLARRHWRRFGRHYYARHDYEELPGDLALGLMHRLAGSLPGLPGRELDGLRVTAADEFSYQDPVDGSLATGQGLRVVFGDRARIVARLSGTGTRGATLRLYLERYEAQATDWPVAEALLPLARIAEQLAGVAAATGRAAPDVVT